MDSVRNWSLWSQWWRLGKVVEGEQLLRVHCIVSLSLSLSLSLSFCLCVCERERQRQRNRERQSRYVCKHNCICECVFVWVCAYVCAHVQTQVHTYISKCVLKNVEFRGHPQALWIGLLPTWLPTWSIFALFLGILICGRSLLLWFGLFWFCLFFF